MYRFFVEPGMCSGESIRITGEDYNHIKNVIRLKAGEVVAVSDGTSREYICEITGYDEEAALARIVDINDINQELPAEITLYQGYPKGDKLELIIQKAVELGVFRVVPVMMKRSVVKLDDKKASKKVERFNSIAESAAKQSKRGIIPEVDRVMSYKEAIEDSKEMDILILPYEDARGMSFAHDLIKSIGDRVEKSDKKLKIGIFIGPEGGFEDKEVELAKECGAEIMSLGHRILRTETAGLAILSILMFELDRD